MKCNRSLVEFELLLIKPNKKHLLSTLNKLLLAKITFVDIAKIKMVKGAAYWNNT